MAMCLERFNIKLTTIYRPLNNIFLINHGKNKKKSYLQVPNQKRHRWFKKFNKIKKFLYSFNDRSRVSEGIKSSFFNHPALTTTMPAQLFKKFNVPIVPVYIERTKQINFKLTIVNH